MLRKVIGLCRYPIRVWEQIATASTAHLRHSRVAYHRAMGKTNPPPVEACKLCGTVTTLKWSHIMPAWSYRRASETGSNSRLVDIRDGVAMYRSNQYAEYMLGGECEQLFGDLETYTSKVTLLASGEFPALAEAKKSAQVGRADVSALDLNKLVRFAVSVVWRAHVSREFAEVSLGPYAKGLADYLRDERATLPDSARVLLQLLAPSADALPIDRILIPPTVARKAGNHAHNFVLVGMWFQVMVGQSFPPREVLPCLERDRACVITDGELLTRIVSETRAAATPKGTFARRLFRAP